MPGSEGLYNIYMMEDVHSVFACGAGGVTKLISKKNHTMERFAMPKYPYEYLNADAPTTADEKSAEQIRRFFAEDPSAGK